ncbi:FAD-dependent oxidoreductase [Methanoculleus sp.]|uniref:FAD-dependent oxidoreductase n=1 Tax=Methanoculleus sp. TaxID=90427 RepID=UPI0025DDBD4A|nr:FAD-dependent oxidoreductase [Methanoculleus sp.]
MDDSVLILGAGPAGMSAASRLLSSNVRFSVIERSDVVGGLAKTIPFGPFSLDIGPHILCTRPYVYDYNERMYQFIKEMLGDRLILYEPLNRKYLESVRVDGDEFIYPIQIKNALQNAGLGHALRIAYDYVRSRFQSPSNPDDGISFEQITTAQLGRSLADLFILKYSEKIWGLKCSALSSDLAWRVGEFSLMSVLIEQFSNLWKDARSQSGHPVCYPAQGIGLICEQIKEKIENAGGKVTLNACPVRILHDNGYIYEVVVREDDTLRSYHPGYVLSSIPINSLVRLLDPEPPAEVIESVMSLRHRSHLCLYLIVNRDRVLREHCIYYPDPEIPFARIMEQKNYSGDTCPDDLASLAVEFFCWHGDDLWNKDDPGLFRIAIATLQELGIVREDEVLDYFVNREQYAYPVYDIGYANRLRTVTAYLEDLKNLKLIGRSGTFTYMGQYRAMEAGSNAADEIIQRRLVNEDPLIQEVVRP